MKPTSVSSAASYQNPASEGGKETELFLPDEFYNKHLSRQVTPGTKYLPKYDEFGNVKQIKFMMIMEER